MQRETTPGLGHTAGVRGRGGGRQCPAGSHSSQVSAFVGYKLAASLARWPRGGTVLPATALMLLMVAMFSASRTAQPFSDAEAVRPVVVGLLVWTATTWRPPSSAPANLAGLVDPARMDKASSRRSVCALDLHPHQPAFIILGAALWVLGRMLRFKGLVQPLNMSRSAAPGPPARPGRRPRSARPWRAWHPAPTADCRTTGRVEVVGHAGIVSGSGPKHNPGGAWCKGCVLDLTPHTLSPCSPTHPSGTAGPSTERRSPCGACPGFGWIGASSRNGQGLSGSLWSAREASW